MFDNLEKDYCRYSNREGNLSRYIYKAISHDGFRAIMLYRLGVCFKQRNMNFLAGMCQRLMHHISHCWISVSAEIGSGFLIAHVGAIGIGGGARIGKNCDVRRNCSIGGNFSKVDEDGRSKPWIGDNVSIGVNAVITGPVRVGSNSIIGANSVVNRDVPENVIVFGVPAKIIRERWNPDLKRGP